MSDVNEFNVQSGEVVLRQYTEQELEQIELDRSSTPQFNIISVPENEALISALVKLQSMGLTTDEAKAIAGL
jgi:uncharacterized protein Smg (DUF494 family)